MSRSDEVELERVNAVPDKVAKAANRLCTNISCHAIAGVLHLNCMFSQLLFALVSSPGDDWLLDWTEQTVVKESRMADDIVALIDVPLHVVEWHLTTNWCFVRKDELEEIAADCSHYLELK